jgi:hypothetical protein
MLATLSCGVPLVLVMVHRCAVAKLEINLNALGIGFANVNQLIAVSRARIATSLWLQHVHRTHGQHASVLRPLQRGHCEDRLARSRDLQKTKLFCSQLPEQMLHDSADFGTVVAY